MGAHVGALESAVEEATDGEAVGHVAPFSCVEWKWGSVAEHMRVPLRSR